jgi:hypothetical protein
MGEMWCSVIKKHTAMPYVFSVFKRELLRSQLLFELS